MMTELVKVVREHVLAVGAFVDEGEIHAVLQCVHLDRKDDLIVVHQKVLAFLGEQKQRVVFRVEDCKFLSEQFAELFAQHLRLDYDQLAADVAGQFVEQQNFQAADREQRRKFER